MSDLNRRNFLHGMGAIGTGMVVSGSSEIAEGQTNPEQPMDNSWSDLPNRVWIGPEYWANPLQDWELLDGKVRCNKAAGNRNLHCLTKFLGQKPGTLDMQVTISRPNGKSLSDGKGSAGFRIGIRGPLEDYRNAIVFGNGLDIGFNVVDGLFIGRTKSKGAAKILDRPQIKLHLTAKPKENAYEVTLSAYDTEGGKRLGQINATVPANRMHGNLALVNNHAGGGRQSRGPAYGMGTFQFSDWSISGSKIEKHPDRAFGPILFSQYTLSNGILKLTAQMPPVGHDDSQIVRLEIERDKNDWKTIGEEKIHPESRTATFRIPNWNDEQDIPYRLIYVQKHRSGDKAKETPFTWTGTIRKDPVDQEVVTVADVSCNIHSAFPNAPYVANMGKLDPDFIAFVGDQFYESTGGYGVQRGPLDKSILDYLRKWWIHGWTWRELMRDRPSISIPDDHDVYQGNIWGEGGAGKQRSQEAGGYGMPAAWVNVVHRTQTSHHPDPFDPKPAKQGISVYFGALNYGRLSFAILADRMFKTGPDGEVPPTGGRADHVTDPNFNPKTADLPGLELLGERQLSFLREWAADWKGADMKAVLSQTIFTAMATTHGGNRQRLVADYDANGWPQSERDKALREIRKAFAIHLAGDQHLPAVVQYGIDEHRDAAVAFAGPAVNVGYPRWWEPKEPGKNREPGSPEITGDFLDHFGNKLTVLAVKNGADKPTGPVMEYLNERASGLGVVRFNKKNRTVTMECWPFLADPTKPDAQFPGWPVTVKMKDNYGRKPAAHLPPLKIQGAENPVVQVINNTINEVEYTLRILGTEFLPMVFDAHATYTVKVGKEEPQFIEQLANLTPRSDRPITIEL